MKNKFDMSKEDNIFFAKRKLVDNNIYTLDIETSSYFFLDGKQHNGLEYAEPVSRVVLLNKQVKLQGKPKDVFGNKEFEQMF